MPLALMFMIDLRLLARRVDEEVNKDGQMQATEDAMKHIRECFVGVAGDRFGAE